MTVPDESVRLNSRSSQSPSSKGILKHLASDQLDIPVAAVDSSSDESTEQRQKCAFKVVKQERKTNKNGDIFVFDEIQIQEFYQARCDDLKVIGKEKQMKKFIDMIKERCIN